MKQTKRFLSLLMAMIMVLSMFPMSVLAEEAPSSTSYENSEEAVINPENQGASAISEEEPNPLKNGQVSITSNLNIDPTISNSASNGYYYQITNTGNQVSGTIVVTNNVENGLMTFRISKNSSVQYSVEGATEKDGVYTMGEDGYANISVTLPKASYSSKPYIRIDHVQVSVITEADIPFAYASSVGSVTVNGTPVDDGEVVTVLPTGATLTAAVTNSDASFLGWVDQNGTLLSAEATYKLIPAGITSVKAAFVHADAPAWFKIGEKLTDNLNTAVTMGSLVILAASGTLPAVKGGYNIPNGVSLLIPRDASDSDGNFTDEADTIETSIDTARNAFRTLKVAPETVINCSGKINVNGAIYKMNGLRTGTSTGDYGCIELGENAVINMNSGSTLYCYGYITGDGAVNANANSTVYEIFQMTGWGGGGTAYAWNNSSTKKSFFLTDYAVQNIEADYTVNYLATAMVTTAVTADTKILGKKTTHTPTAFIGENSGLIRLTGGDSVKREYDPQTNRVKYILSGTPTVSGISLNIDLGLLGSFPMNSANYVLAINSYMDFVAAEGSKVTLSNDYKLMPGASITVEDGATVEVNGRLFLYDVQDYTKASAPVKYIASTKANSGIPASRATSAQLILDGANAVLEVKDVAGVQTKKAAIYTTNGGGSLDKVLKGTGKFINNSTVAATSNQLLDEFTFEGSGYDTEITINNITVVPVVGRLAGISNETEYDKFNTGEFIGLGDGWWYQQTVSFTGDLDELVPEQGTIISADSNGTIGYSVSGGAMYFTLPFNYTVDCVGATATMAASAGSIAMAYTVPVNGQGIVINVTENAEVENNAIIKMLNRGDKSPVDELKCYIPVGTDVSAYYAEETCTESADIFAAGDVLYMLVEAKIGKDNYYNTLGDAVRNATTPGDVVTLISDIQVDDPIYVTSEQDIDIYLGGYNVTYGSEFMNISGTVDLDLQGSTVTNKHTAEGEASALVVANGGDLDLKLNGGTLSWDMNAEDVAADYAYSGRKYTAPLVVEEGGNADVDTTNGTISVDYIKTISKDGNKKLHAVYNAGTMNIIGNGTGTITSNVHTDADSYFSSDRTVEYTAAVVYNNGANADLTIGDVAVSVGHEVYAQKNGVDQAYSYAFGVANHNGANLSLRGADVNGAKGIALINIGSNIEEISDATISGYYGISSNAMTVGGIAPCIELIGDGTSIEGTGGYGINIDKDSIIDTIGGNGAVINIKGVTSALSVSGFINDLGTASDEEKGVAASHLTLTATSADTSHNALNLAAGSTVTTIGGDIDFRAVYWVLDNYGDIGTIGTAGDTITIEPTVTTGNNLLGMRNYGTIGTIGGEGSTIKISKMDAPSGSFAYPVLLYGPVDLIGAKDSTIEITGKSNSAKGMYGMYVGSNAVVNKIGSSGAKIKLIDSTPYEKGYGIYVTGGGEIKSIGNSATIDIKSYGGIWIANGTIGSIGDGGYINIDATYGITQESAAVKIGTIGSDTGRVFIKAAVSGIYNSTTIDEIKGNTVVVVTGGTNYAINNIASAAVITKISGGDFYHNSGRDNIFGARVEAAVPEGKHLSYGERTVTISEDEEYSCYYIFDGHEHKAGNSELTYNEESGVWEMVVRCDDPDCNEVISRETVEAPLIEINENGAKYADLASAVAAAGPDDEIRVLANIEVTTPVVIPAGKSVKVDLLGKTITYASSVFQINGSLELDLNGGTITNKHTAKGEASALVVANGGDLDLKLNGGTLSWDMNAEDVAADYAYSNTKYTAPLVVEEGGNADVDTTGGTISVDYIKPISKDGNKKLHAVYNAGTMNITGDGTGKITSNVRTDGTTYLSTERDTEWTAAVVYNRGSKANMTIGKVEISVGDKGNAFAFGVANHHKATLSIDGTVIKSANGGNDIAVCNIGSKIVDISNATIKGTYGISMLPMNSGGLDPRIDSIGGKTTIDASGSYAINLMSSVCSIGTIGGTNGEITIKNATTGISTSGIIGTIGGTNAKVTIKNATTGISNSGTISNIGGTNAEINIGGIDAEFTTQNVTTGISTSGTIDNIGGDNSKINITGTQFAINLGKGGHIKNLGTASDAQKNVKASKLVLTATSAETAYRALYVGSGATVDNIGGNVDFRAVYWVLYNDGTIGTIGTAGDTITIEPTATSGDNLAGILSNGPITTLGGEGSTIKISKMYAPGHYAYPILLYGNVTLIGDDNSKIEVSGKSGTGKGMHALRVGNKGVVTQIGSPGATIKLIDDEPKTTGYGIYVTGTGEITNIGNGGTIVVDSYHGIVIDTGNIGTIGNGGTIDIDADKYGIYVAKTGKIANIDGGGYVDIDSGDHGIYVTGGGTITNIGNGGTIDVNAKNNGIYLDNGTISKIGGGANINVEATYGIVLGSGAKEIETIGSDTGRIFIKASTSAIYNCTSIGEIKGDTVAVVTGGTNYTVNNVTGTAAIKKISGGYFFHNSGKNNIFGARVADAVPEGMRLSNIQKTIADYPCYFIADANHTHSFNNPTAVWNEVDGKIMATVSLNCAVENCDEETITQTVEAVDESVAATCTTAGQTIYRAVAEFNGVEYPVSYEAEIPATGHTPGEPVIENNVPATFENEGSYDKVIYCANEGCNLELSRETVVVPAQGSVIEINENGKKYADLASAVAAADSGDVIRVLANIEVTTPVVIPVGESVKVDLLGNTITYASTVFQINGALELDLNGGAITNKHTAEAETSALIVANGGDLDLKLNGGTLSWDMNADDVAADYAYSNTKYTAPLVVEEGGTADVDTTGGTISVDYIKAISKDGNNKLHAIYNAGTMNITGDGTGKITSNVRTDASTYLPTERDAEWTAAVVYNRGSKANMTIGDVEVSVGQTTSNIAFAVANHYSATMTISGATVKGANGIAICNIGSKIVEIRDATITGKYGISLNEMYAGGIAPYIDKITGNTTIEVTGGYGIAVTADSSIGTIGGDNAVITIKGGEKGISGTAGQIGYIGGDNSQINISGKYYGVYLSGTRVTDIGGENATITLGATTENLTDRYAGLHLTGGAHVENIGTDGATVNLEGKTHGAYFKNSTVKNLGMASDADSNLKASNLTITATVDDTNSYALYVDSGATIDTIGGDMSLKAKRWVSHVANGGKVKTIGTDGDTITIQPMNTSGSNFAGFINYGWVGTFGGEGSNIIISGMNTSGSSSAFAILAHSNIDLIGAERSTITVTGTGTAAAHGIYVGSGATVKQIGSANSVFTVTDTNSKNRGYGIRVYEGTVESIGNGAEITINTFYGITVGESGKTSKIGAIDPGEGSIKLHVSGLGIGLYSAKATIGDIVGNIEVIADIYGIYTVEGSTIDKLGIGLVVINNSASYCTIEGPGNINKITGGYYSHSSNEYAKVYSGDERTLPCVPEGAELSTTTVLYTAGDNNTYQCFFVKGGSDHEHEFTWNATKAPTCTEKGEEVGKCALCDVVETREVAALGHAYKVVVTRPTVDQQGYTTHTCTVCGYSYVDGYTEPRNTYNILMIGNSFSWDAADNWYNMSESMTYNAMKSMVKEGYDVHLAVMYTGSSTLSYQAYCLETNYSGYTFTEIGPSTNYKWSPINSKGGTTGQKIQPHLDERDWDVIVVQGYQHELDGAPASASPNATIGSNAKFYDPKVSVPYLLDYYAEHEPGAEVYFYMPLATTKYYEGTADHGTLSPMANNVKDGFLASAENVKNVIMKLTGTESGKELAGIIPVGTGIQNARTTYFDALRFSGTTGTYLEKDPQIGLQYDQQHLSFGIGRYIAGLIVADTLIPQEIRKESFTWPKLKDSPSAGVMPDEYTEIAQMAAAAAMSNPYQITTISGYETDLADRVCEAIALAEYSRSNIDTDDALQAYLTSQIQQQLADMGNLGKTSLSIEINSLHDAKVTIRVGYTTRTVQIHVHNEVIKPAVDPTCTETGLTEGKYCSGCNEVLVAQTVVEATGHSYSEEVTEAATCTEAGVKTFTCQCGDTYTEEIEAKGHSLTETEANAPTCTTPGNTAYWTCGTCGKYFSDADGKNEIQEGSWDLGTASHSYGEPQFSWNGYECTAKVVCACGHEESIDVTVSSEVNPEATCKVEGIETYTATAEYKEVTYTSEEHPTKNLGLDANNHKDTKEEAQVDATCTSIGYTAGIYCNDCEKWISGHEEIKKLDHDYAEAWQSDEAGHWHKCNNCDATTEIEAHAAGEAVEENRVEATTEAAGSYDSVVYCTVCGVELSREEIEIPKLEAVGTTVNFVNYTAGTNKAVVTVDGSAIDYKQKEAVSATLGADGAFTVTCAKSCVVAYTTDGVSYTKVTGTKSNGVYSFTIETPVENMTIAVLYNGDVNEDGSLTSADAALTLRYAVDLEVLDSLQRLVAEVNSDGSITSADAAKILRVVVDLDTGF